MIRIDDFKLLLTLQEVGTIRGAAKKVLISQPAVSQRLRYIENYYAEKIFIRTPKRLVLTATGEIILDYAKSIIGLEQTLKNVLAQSTGDVRGTLSIACSSLISQRYLPEVLSDFTAEFPNVSIDLVSSISETIKREHQNYHVCIIRGEKLAGSTCLHLLADPLYVFDTEDFLHDGLKKRPLISFKTDDRMDELVDEWLAHETNIQAIKAIHVDQIETCKQFMMQGLGMAVLPQSVSGSLMDEYPHKPLKVKGKLVTRDTWVCYQDEVRQLSQVNAFINQLTEKIYL